MFYMMLLLLRPKKYVERMKKGQHDLCRTAGEHTADMSVSPSWRPRGVGLRGCGGSGTIGYDEFLKMMTHNFFHRDLKDEMLKDLIPPEAKKALDLFLMQSNEEPADEGLAVSAPEANAYEFQSHGIIEMLEKLLDKFVDELTALEKEEMNSKHAYDMLMQDLTAQIEQATADRTEKAETKAKKLQSKADAEGDLEDTTTTRDADQKYLDDLKATCSQKASDLKQGSSCALKNLRQFQRPSKSCRAVPFLETQISICQPWSKKEACH